MAELRWILSGLGVVAIAAIWWWSTRRSGQAPGNSELRESTVMPLQGPGPEFRDRPETRERHEPRDWPEARDRPEFRERPEPRDRAEPEDFRERSISPLEPLSIRTADFERVPVLDLPVMTTNPEPDPGSHHDPVEDLEYIESSMPGLIDGDAPAEESSSAAQTTAASPHAAARSAPSLPTVPAQALGPAQAPPDPGAGGEQGDRPAAAEPSAPNLSERQKIVTLRVCAVGEARWSGRDLMSALEGHGLAYGRYQVYHRKHADGESIFFVASLIEPGTFDAARMAEEEFRGVSMFALLPGPIEPLQAIDAMLTTARELARNLSGTVQDAKGMPFSPQRIATLREDVARFQSSLLGPAG